MRYLVLGCLLLSGCLLVPFVEAVHDSGVTPAGRRQKLAEAVKFYEEAVYWGNAADAVAFVVPDKREPMQRQLALARRGAQVISTVVVSTSFDTGSESAKVVVATKRFQKDSLVVKEEFEEQQWVYGFGNGWQLNDRRPMSEEEAVG